jgi:hypothetical protein
MKSSAVESRIDGFLCKYTPEIKARLQESRSRLRGFFPRGFELVFDNYNALVFAISPSERRSDAFVSVVGYPNWVTLFFRDGVDLDDPRGLLEGKGKQFRSIRLKNAESLNSNEIGTLIGQLIRPNDSAVRAAPALTTVIKSVVKKQRPRRPKSASVAPPEPPVVKRSKARR